MGLLRPAGLTTALNGYATNNCRHEYGKRCSRENSREYTSGEYEEMKIFKNNSFRLFILLVLYIVGMALIPLLLYLPSKYPLFIFIYTIGFPFAMMRYYMIFIDFISKKVLNIDPGLRRKGGQNNAQNRSGA